MEKNDKGILDYDKTMRSTKEILELILTEFINRSLYSYGKYRGLCFTLKKLFENGMLSGEEYDIGIKYIRKNAKPHFYQKRYYCEEGMANYEVIDQDLAFFWKPYLQEPRIEWLKKHIKKNS